MVSSGVRKHRDGGLAWIFSPSAPPSLHLSVFHPIIHVDFQSRHRSLLLPVSKAVLEAAFKWHACFFVVVVFSYELLVSAVTYDGYRRRHQTGLKGSRHRTEITSQGIGIFIPPGKDLMMWRVLMMKAASTCCSTWLRRRVVFFQTQHLLLQFEPRYLLAAPLLLALFLGVVS